MSTRDRVEKILGMFVRGILFNMKIGLKAVQNSKFEFDAASRVLCIFFFFFFVRYLFCVVKKK